jgi:hypothetical protein
LLTFLFAAAMTIGWLATNRIHTSSQKVLAKPTPFPVDESLSVLATRVNLQTATRPHARPIYRYSVIPGGVRSAEELRLVTARDQAVADHYAGFRYDRSRMVRLQHGEMVYLSYRMNGKIYWTRTRHPLPAGEMLITDGEITGRTRCANRISVKKQLGVAPIEPPQAELDQIEPPPMFPPENVNFPAQYQSAVLTGLGPGSPWVGPQVGDPWFLFPPPLPLAFLGGGCRPVVKKAGTADKGDDDNHPCQSSPPVKPPSPVPEPGTWILLGTGALGLYVVVRVRRATH